jgi:hypothetical protein
MNSERKHSRGRYLATAVPSEVRICTAKVAEAYEAEGVVNDENEKVDLEPRNRGQIPRLVSQDAR